MTLSWQAPTGCPDQASELAEIRRRLAGAARSTAGPIEARGEIRRDPAGYVLSLRTAVAGTTGERVLSGPDCQPLGEAAALILAMLINPEAAAGPAPSPALPPPLPSSPPAPAPPPRCGFGAGVEALLATGLLPGWAGGLALHLFYGRGSFQAALQVAGFLSQTVDVPLWTGATASFYRLDSALQVCATTSLDRRLGGALCVGGALARLHGRSAGIAQPGEASGTWLEASLAPSVHVRLTSATRLRLAADARGLGGRPDLAIAGLGRVYRPAAFSLRFGLGFDYWF
mgnify:CR=1 FL=1